MSSAAAGAPARRGGAALFVLIASAAFATSSPIGKWAAPTHPILIAFGRLALAALLLGAVNLRAIAASLRALSARQRWTVFAAGALLAGHFGAFQWGLDRTSLPAASALVSLEPISVVLSAWLLLGVRPTRREQLGLLVATLGAIVVAQGPEQGEHRLEGDLVVLFAVALYGLYLAVARALKDALPAQSYAALVYAGAAVVLAVAVPAIPGARASAAALPAHALVAIAALALIPTIVGHTAVQTASRTLSPTIVALVSPGETLGAMTLGAFALGKVPTTTELAGAIIILVGSAITIAAPKAGESGGST